MSLTLESDIPFLESVIARMPGFLYRCKADKEFTMMELTSGFERSCGFPASDILNNSVRSFASLIHPDDGQAVDEAVVVGLEERRNWNINYRLLHVSGSYMWVHEDGGGVWDETGAVAYLEGVVWDIRHLYMSLERQFNGKG
jgi:PAS domain-containing protein